MPKVSSEYFDNKRKMIVEAAYHVCLRKPAEVVTISDVIAETGMSQGAIYRYYDGLDSILADMVTKMRQEYSFIEDMDKIINDKVISFEEKTYSVCNLLAEHMESHLMDIQKINFDLGVLVINEPERGEKIMSQIKGDGNMDYLSKVVFPNMVMDALNKGYKPKDSIENICTYLSSSYTGIEKLCILGACYGDKKSELSVKPSQLFNTLAQTTILLLGGKVNE